jgi:hypothetical protein
MLPWIIFITIPVLLAAFLSGRFSAKYAAQRGRSERAWSAKKVRPPQLAVFCFSTIGAGIGSNVTF